MSQFIQTNGDYTIKTRAEGIITLDTGPSIGEVRVTGNLIVEGDTLTISAEELQVDDNVILLNRGETGAGVTKRYSGIEIDRGTVSNANIIYDDTEEAFLFTYGSDGTYSYELGGGEVSSIKVKRILTPDSGDQDLVLVGNGTGVITVRGTTNYEDQITDPDDIPNKAYVDAAIRDNPTFQIVDDDTRIVVTDLDVTDAGSDFATLTSYPAPLTSAISVLVDGVLVSQYYQDRVLIGEVGRTGIEIDGENIEIRTEDYDDSNSETNLYLRTGGTGKIKTNYAIQLEKISNSVNYVAGSVTINAQDPSVGATGLYFSNSNVEGGELISKNRALLFSMIF